MNPWISIWLKPRQTIRQILDTDPKRGVLLLAVAGGMADVLVQGLGSFVEMKIHLAIAAVICMVLGGLFGLFGLYLLGWLYRWVGKWFGGQARNVEVRAALAWTQDVPVLWLFGLWAALLLVTGGDLLKFQGKTAPPAGEVTLLAALFSVVLGAATVVVALWRFILGCKAIAEAHRFSGWKGFGTVTIPMALVMIPVVAVISSRPHLMKAREDARARAGVSEPAPTIHAPPPDGAE